MIAGYVYHTDYCFDSFVDDLFLGGNLSDLTSAIGDMRSSKGSDTPSISVNMPGGKSVLGQSGIENKVNVWCHSH